MSDLKLDLGQFWYSPKATQLKAHVRTSLSLHHDTPGCEFPTLCSSEDMLSQFYISRGPKIGLVLSVVLSPDLSFANSNDESDDRLIESILSDLELWAQVGIKCYLRGLEHISSNTLRIEVDMLPHNHNESPFCTRRPPSADARDVKPPNLISTIQLACIHWNLNISLQPGPEARLDTGLKTDISQEVLSQLVIIGVSTSFGINVQRSSDLKIDTDDAFCGLNSIAPLLFRPGLAQLTKVRSQLISPIAKFLASFSSTKANQAPVHVPEDAHTQPDQQYQERELYERQLWNTMMSGLDKRTFRRSIRPRRPLVVHSSYKGAVNQPPDSFTSNRREKVNGNERLDQPRFEDDELLLRGAAEIKDGNTILPAVVDDDRVDFVPYSSCESFDHAHIFSNEVLLDGSDGCHGSDREEDLPAEQLSWPRDMLLKERYGFETKLRSDGAPVAYEDEAGSNTELLIEQDVVGDQWWPETAPRTYANRSPTKLKIDRQQSLNGGNDTEPLEQKASQSLSRESRDKGVEWHHLHEPMLQDSCFSQEDSFPHLNDDLMLRDCDPGGESTMRAGREDLTDMLL